MQTCRLNGQLLTPVLDLGMQPLGNGFLKDPSGSEYWFPLACGFNDESMLFQLITQPAPELMFHDSYAFFSGTSRRMAQHFEALAEQILTSGLLRTDDPFIVELGSNDGILLRHFAVRNVRHLGVEPSRDVGLAAREQGVDVLSAFFGKDVALGIAETRGKADLLVAANVMCHIPDLQDLLAGIDALVAEDGVVMFEDPYLGDVVRLGSYDQIYDEHVFLFSALSVKQIFATIDFELIDVEPLTTHGGSMRYTLGRRGRRQPSARVTEVLRAEVEQGLDRTDTFLSFATRVGESATALKEVLERVVSEGSRVAAYGATSKSTTIYNFAGIGPDLISCIYDNTPGKIGTFSPGKHIPIREESAFAVEAPDVTFLAAWNHEREILGRYDAYAQGGGRWLTHVPSVRFLD